jgi:hypothetical protein
MFLNSNHSLHRVVKGKEKEKQKKKGEPREQKL